MLIIFISGLWNIFCVLHLQVVVSHSSHGKTEGVVLTCGEGDVGQLGLGPDVMERMRAGFVNIPDPVIQVCAGGMHTVCLTSKGQVRFYFLSYFFLSGLIYNYYFWLDLLQESLCSLSPARSPSTAAVYFHSDSEMKKITTMKTSDIYIYLYIYCYYTSVQSVGVLLVCVEASFLFSCGD